MLPTCHKCIVTYHKNHPDSIRDTE
jgi:hypothetical protein